MKTDPKPPARDAEQLQKLRRELLDRIVKNEARRRNLQITTTKETRRA